MYVVNLLVSHTISFSLYSETHIFVFLEMYVLRWQVRREGERW